MRTNHLYRLVNLAALIGRHVRLMLRANTRGSAPSDNTLARLTGSGATVYRTDENGTIRLTSDGQQVWIETER